MRFAKIVAINPPSPPGYVANRDSMGGYMASSTRSEPPLSWAKMLCSARGLNRCQY